VHILYGTFMIIVEFSFLTSDVDKIRFDAFLHKMESDRKMYPMKQGIIEVDRYSEI